MKNLAAIALALVALQASLAYGVQMASPKSNNLVKICTVQQGEVADAACQAFVQGVVEVTSFYSAAQQIAAPFCVPLETAPEEMVAIYRDYLKSHHELRQFSAAALAVSALKEAFPCEQGDGS